MFAAVRQHKFALVVTLADFARVCFLDLFDSTQALVIHDVFDNLLLASQLLLGGCSVAYLAVRSDDEFVRVDHVLLVPEALSTSSRVLCTPGHLASLIKSATILVEANLGRIPLDLLLNGQSRCLHISILTRGYDVTVDSSCAGSRRAVRILW